MRPARSASIALLGATLVAGSVHALVPAEVALADRMRAAGLEGIAPTAGPSPALRGILPGEGELRVLLFAGCGPGAERGRDVALAAVTDLARTPRRHTLEVVLCPVGGSAPGAARSVAAEWLAQRPSGADREAVLAALHLELGDPPAGRAVGLLLAAGAGDRRLPPAWLAHAVLAGARAGGSGLAIGDQRWPVMGQLLGRFGRLRQATGAELSLAAGVPALTLAGGDAGWPAALAGIVRRLDSLAGRPRGDDVYLALAGRVWSRRDLYWVGLAVFVALLAAARPGAWRGAASGDRRRRGRRYVPGFLFRLLFLVDLLLAPAATLVLLAPAALLTVVPLRRPAAVRLARLLAVVPVACLAGYWALAVFEGRVEAWPAAPLRLALLLAGVGLGWVLLGRPRRPA